MAVLYSEGHGVKRDYKEAVRLLRLASEQGHARAQTRLAHHLFYGRGTPINYMDAVSWYEKAAENGSVSAMYHLGYCAENALGTPKNLSRAIHYYELAASYGDEKSNLKLIGLLSSSSISLGHLQHVPSAA